MTELTLPAPAATFVHAGGLDVEWRAVDPAVPAGASVRLVDVDGVELGLALADPDNQRLRLLVRAADGLTRVDGTVLALRLERAMALRTRLGLPGADAAYRLLNGAGDGVPGFTCDVYGRFAVIHAYAPALVPLARVLAEAVRGFARVDGVVIKTRTRGGADDVAHEVVGTAPPDQHVARERGVPYQLHLQRGLNVGLFTDMRQHRDLLAPLAAGARVLNLFSYTGAFSVACARAGAASVVSVDTSPGVHAWAQANFRLSELADDRKRWRFEAGDAVRFLARAERERERYDLVIIDPPTFSTARGAPWTVDRDYPPLIAQALGVIPDGGLVWLACNTHDGVALGKLVGRAVGSAGRPATVLSEGGLPPDYPTVPAQPKDRYLQTMLLRVG
ncbi:MAG: class I SAM-dependent rRNA methyltransferase [Kofleriaceae bacterium]|jgi:23S rRNA (cytosine1962-C5)-methyltransferase|nr:class I SAM-dependent rRNA methyltransferase [Kofleriaceae bacterium]MBP6836915.1 class I SAM-dependent rRNA methyltransferase [Kofleriaceae bacterium]